MSNLATIRKSVYFLYSWILVLYTSLILYPNFPLFLGVHGFVPNAAIFDSVFVAMALPFVLFTSSHWLRFVAKPYAIWCFALLAILAWNYWRINNLDAVIDLSEIASQQNRLQRTVLLGLYAYLVFVIGSQKFVKALIPVVFVLPLLTILDFFQPELMNPIGALSDAGRAEGTFLNANMAAEAILFTMLLTYRQLTPYLLVIVFLLGGLGIIATFSRAGLAAWVMFCMLLLISRSVPRWFFLLPISMIIFYSSIIIYIEEVLSSLFDNKGQVANMVDRISFFVDVGTTGVQDDSGEGRTEIAKEVFQASLQKPIFGHARPAEDVFESAAHNLTIDHWYTFGIAGVLLCFSMAYLLNRESNNRILGRFSPEMLFFVWFSLFEHVMFEPNFYFLFFAITLLGNQDKNSQNYSKAHNVGVTKKKRKRSTRRRSKIKHGWKGRFG